MTFESHLPEIQPLSTAPVGRTCRDCHGHMPWMYMVHEHVWMQAWPTYEDDTVQAIATSRRDGRNEEEADAWLFWNWSGNICPRCLELRLGRALTAEDLTSAPVNDAIRVGLAMAQKRDQT